MASSTMQEPSVQEFLSTKSELQLRNYLVKVEGGVARCVDHLLLMRLVQMGVDHIKSVNHSVPPISGGSISPSGLLDTCMTAFPRMRQRENRWKSCLVAIPSSSPDCLAKAEASRLSWMTATLCNPPSVSAAIGRKEIPCSWQAAAVAMSYH